MCKIEENEQNTISETMLNWLYAQLEHAVEQGTQFGPCLHLAWPKDDDTDPVVVDEHGNEKYRLHWQLTITRNED